MDILDLTDFNMDNKNLSTDKSADRLLDCPAQDDLWRSEEGSRP